MNIMCVKNNNTIFYIFVNIGSKNTQFYKDEIFIPQNPKKKKKKLKYIVLFTQTFLAPRVLTQHANILLNKSLMP
jgi:hypothetical protein